MAKWKFVKSNKPQDAYGETDFDNKVIRINKKIHKSKRKKKITPNKDGTENLLMTELHELIHKKHPKKGERTTEKLARAMKSRMSKKQKGRIYAKFN